MTNAVTVASASTQPGTVEVALTPDGPATAELELTLRPGAESGRLDFFVRQDGTQPLDHVTVMAAAGDMAVAVTDAHGKTDITVPPGGGAVLLRAEVTGLSQPRDVRLRACFRPSADS